VKTPVQLHANFEYKHSIYESKEKKFIETINLGSSFEYLDTRISKQKIVRSVEKRFSKYFVLEIRIKQ
jgi:hypothetical protein